MDNVLTVEKLRKVCALAQRPRSLLADDQKFHGWNGQFLRNSNITVPKSRLRTWRERLFTWPWCPWKSVQMWQVPDPDVYMMDMPNIDLHTYKTKGTKKMIVGHPATIAKIEEALRENEKSISNFNPNDPSRRFASWPSY